MTTKIIDSSCVPDQRDTRQVCGCINHISGGITFCPLHTAALELLAACKELMEFKETNQEQWLKLPSEFMGIYATAWAAIAKAEGH